MHKNKNQRCEWTAFFALIPNFAIPASEKNIFFVYYYFFYISVRVLDPHKLPEPKPWETNLILRRSQTGRAHIALTAHPIDTSRRHIPLTHPVDAPAYRIPLTYPLAPSAYRIHQRRLQSVVCNLRWFLFQSILLLNKKIRRGRPPPPSRLHSHFSTRPPAPPAPPKKKNQKTKKCTKIKIKDANEQHFLRWFRISQSQPQKKTFFSFIIIFFIFLSGFWILTSCRNRNHGKRI